MAVAERPVELDQALLPPADDGLFGPGSVTWRVMASPASSIGTSTAVLAQMLHPRVVRLIIQASTFERNPELRARLTAEYGMTTTYGDTVLAENAGETLRKLHSRMKAVDIDTGEAYDANEPDLLRWVHCTIPWALLRACDRWGPELSPAEQDRFVFEQRQAARLVGLDPESVPGNVADLEAYIEQMIPRLAYTTEAGRIRAIMIPRRIPRSGAEVLMRLMALAAADLLTPEMRHLYGYWWGPLQRGLLASASSPLMRAAVKKTPYERAIPKMREHAQAHAFGANALKINKQLRQNPAASPEASPNGKIGPEA
jgi:uncharacterized protein (DUF2236 family)